MGRYHVTETVVYEVEADDAEHAEQIIVDADDRNEYFSEVSDRRVKSIGE